MSHRPHLRAPVAAMLFVLCAACFASTALADPSGRVAYLSDTQGVVSYSPSGQDEWISVVRNRPLIRGDRLWTDNSARAEIQVGSSAIRIASNTSVEILDLDDRIAQVQLAQGTLSLSVRRLYSDQVIEIDTPLLAFTVTRAGRYRIDVDPASGETTIVVWEGAGEAYGQNTNFPLRTGDTVRFFDADLSDHELYGLPREDDFDLYSLARDQRFDRSASLRYVDDDLVGYADLDDYGSWGSVRSYGNVWFPTGVPIGWAPYRDGHWVWQEPWGWTWVDNAPWGFAPSHYGRWVYVGNSWGWVPGPRNVRPIYAPALVAFIGGNDWNLSTSFDGASPIGWFPLGPREVYVPSYQASYDYFNQVNVNNTVINNTTITNVYNNYSSGNINVNQANYANRDVEQAITVVPGNVFENAQPVGPAAIRVDRKALKTGETMRIAPIAPSERSVMGAGNKAKAHPAPEVFDRRVVAHNAPPPAESPFAKRAKYLQQHPGQGGLEPAAVETAQSGTAEAAKNIVVIGEQKNAVDARAKGSRRAAKSAQPQQLDRSVEAMTHHEPGKADTNEQSAQQQAQRMADSEKRAAQQQQRQPDSDQQAAQHEQAQRMADSEKRAVQQQQRQSDIDKQAAQQEQAQRMADSEKRAAQQRQHQADIDQQAAQQQQRQADSEKRAAQQQQRQADYDRQAAQQEQRQADIDKQAAQQQQRQADYDQQAAQQQQHQADYNQRATQQQQRQADYDQRASQQQQRQADYDQQAAQQQRQSEYDRQSAQQQQGQPEGRAKGGRQMDQATEPHTYETTGQDASEKQQPRNRAQSECEREARQQGQDESLCQDKQ